MADSSLLFDDLFTLTSLDKDGKKFDRVSRLNAVSSNHNMQLTLDFNIELYPLRVGDSFALALSSSLTPEGEKDGGAEIQSWRLEEGKGGLADEYEYVMYGKVGVLWTGAHRIDLHLDSLDQGSLNTTERVDECFEQLYKFDTGASDSVTCYISFGGLLMALSGDYRHLDRLTVGQMLFLLLRK